MDTIEELYIAFTPYHVLLASAISKPGEEALIVSQDFANAGELIRILREHSEFAAIIPLSGTFQTKGAYLQYFRIAMATRKASKVAHEIRPTTIYTFNDSRPESQVILHQLVRTFDARAIYIEDGIAAYTSDRLQTPGWLRQVAAKIVYGPWWSPIDIYGTSEWIDRVAAIHPQYLREELRSKCVKALNKSSITSLANSRWLQAIGNNVVFEKEPTSLIIAPHSERFSSMSAWNNFIADTIAHARANGKNLVLKLHPREKSLNVSSNIAGISLYPKGVPLEVIFLLGGRTLSYVIGPVSTSLISAGWMLSSADVVGLVGDDFQDENIRNLLGHLGVELEVVEL